MRLVHDIEIVTVTHLVIDTVNRDPDFGEISDSIKGMLSYWRKMLDAYAPGCLDLRLDETIRNKEDQDSLVKLLNNVRHKLQKCGQVITGETLDQIVDAPGLFEFGDRSIADIITAFDKFIKLLDSEHD
jgi:hypothetical protein